MSLRAKRSGRSNLWLKSEYVIFPRSLWSLAMTKVFMFNFLHTFNPSPVLLSFGPINIYWYGFFIVLGVLAAITVAIYLAKLHNIKSETIIDLAVWLIIGGLIGARLYDIGLEWPYFYAHPLDSFKIWQGGLAIHGGILGGLIALWFYVKKTTGDFWQLAAIVITGLPLAQAIGRFGNYFNQELFGYPTNLAWGIPIDQLHRPLEYLNYGYFHPAFLYESIGNLLIFIFLFIPHYLIIKKNKITNSAYFLLIAAYFLLYSSLRFITEFIRVDAAPVIFGWRFPQLISLIIIIFCLTYCGIAFYRKISQNKTLEK